MNNLLEELLILIILELNCKGIIFMHRVSKNFNRLNLHLLLEQKKFKNFPRKEGYCISHRISEHIKTLNLDQLKLDAVNYLYDNNADLVYGDIVVFDHLYDKIRLDKYSSDCNKCIYDGIKIININYNHFYDGYLPNQFRVIENNVSLRYWKETNDMIRIKYNQIIWFNHKLVIDQCIGNISYEYNNDIHYIYTIFTYNKIIYRINFCDINTSLCFDDPKHFDLNNLELRSKKIQLFKDMLLDDKLIEYVHDENNNNTLYVNCVKLHGSYFL